MRTVLNFGRQYLRPLGKCVALSDFTEFVEKLFLVTFRHFHHGGAAGIRCTTNIIVIALGIFIAFRVQHLV
jgi:hypothetical protein